MNRPPPSPPPSPPREILPTHPHPIGKAIAWLFFVGVIGLALVLAGYLLYDLAFFALGREIEAKVSSINEAPDAFIGGQKHVARYTYTGADGQPRSGESAITWDEHRRLKLDHVLAGGRGEEIHFPESAGKTLRIVAVDVAPLSLNRAAAHGLAGVFRVGALLLLPAFLLLCAGLYLQIVVRPRRRRWLYTHGRTVPGIVTGKRAHWSASYNQVTHWLVYYTFAPAAHAATATASALNGVDYPRDVELFNFIAEGQPVTVLYDPDRPARNLTYEYGGYRWA